MLCDTIIFYSFQILREVERTWERRGERLNEMRRYEDWECDSG